MYAIVEIAGQQFKASKNDKLFVHRLPEKEGNKVSFDNVLLIDDGKKVKLGDPKISGAKVNAKILSHLKGDKIIVFKKKRRKGYKIKNGHRQMLTKIKSDDISVSKKKKSVEKKEVDTKKTTVKKTTAKK